MAYADFAFYRDTWYGEILTEENAARWLSRASDELDGFTFGRLASAFPAENEERVRKAVCAVADALFLVDVQRRAAAPKQGADGLYHGPVASVTSGKESVSYATGGSAAAADMYGAAASSPEALAELLYGIAVKYLADIPDASGVNLLYAGL